MDQIKIGKFISHCRKEKNLTQAQLAEQLNISNRAVSKCETGKSCPDASIMLDLCDILGISVNELLTGERIEMEEYYKNAETNLVTMKQKDETGERKVLLLGFIMLGGYGILGILAILMFVYHLYLNYTDANYTGMYFNYLTPLLIIMFFLAFASVCIFLFIQKYDIVRKEQK